MSVTNVNSQRPAIQPLQTQQNAFAPAAQQQTAKQDPLAALTKALEALEKAVQSLSSNKSFSNGQSVAQQAGQNIGQSGASKQPAFDWTSLLGGGSSFEKQAAAPTPPVAQKQDNSFLTGSGGGAGPVTNAHVDNGLHLGNEKSGGGGTGVRIGSDGANN